MLENYVNARIPLKHRSAIAKCRCGVAPLRLETGRYENLPEDLGEVQFEKKMVQKMKFMYYSTVMLILLLELSCMQKPVISMLGSITYVIRTN